MHIKCISIFTVQFVLLLKIELLAAAAAAAKLAGAAIELVSEISQIRENDLIESKECHWVSQAGWRAVLPVLHSTPLDIVCRCAN